MFQDAVTSAIQTVDIAGKSGLAPLDRSLVPWSDLPSILLRRSGWIVAAVVVAVVAAFLLIALLPPSYTASTEIVVQPTDLKAFDQSVNQVSNQPDTSVATVETAARVIGSRKVLEPVVAKLGLATDPEFMRSPSRLRALVGRVRGAFGLPPDTLDADPMEDALQRLDKRLGVRRSERTFVIDVTVKLDDAVKAARIANAIVDSFLEVQANARADASHRVSETLTARLGELRDNLRRSEDAVHTFRMANNLVVANGQLVNEQQLSDASNQLLAAENRTADAKAKLDQVDAAAHGRDPGAIPESLQSQTIGALRSQLAQVSRQEADARATFGERHPQLTQIRSQVDAVRRALDGEVQRIRDTARSEYERARSGEANLRTNLARQQRKGAQANAAQIKLRELERDAEASRSVYQAFLVRARETAEQERVDTLNAWVMSPAVAPTDRSFPPPNLAVLGAAFAAGLVLGLACALARELLDPRLWTAGRVAAVTGVPVLATIDVPKRRPDARSPLGDSIDLEGELPGSRDAMLGLVQDLTAGRASAPGRSVLLLGQQGEEDAGLAARCLAAAAVAEGHRVLHVRLLPGDSTSDLLLRVDGSRAANDDAPARLLDLREPSEPWQVPVLIERLKGCAATLGGGLLIVAARHGAPAAPQLAKLADATVLVLTRAHSTRSEARAMAQRLRGKFDAQRGAILLRREA